MCTVLGIDEAGRGPVIGSMFIAGFKVEEEDIEKLQQLGVRDSKKLGDSRRDSMAEELRRIGSPYVKEFEAADIDELREVMTLNEIEIEGFVDVIERADADKVYLDLPEPNAERFVGKLKSKLPESFEDRKFVAEHGADEKYPVVSAASIIAKSARERHVDELKKKYGFDFESGYPHDAPTIEFLETYLEENGELPAETRRSWSTAERIVRNSDQSGLQDF